MGFGAANSAFRRGLARGLLDLPASARCARIGITVETSSRQCCTRQLIDGGEQRSLVPMPRHPNRLLDHLVGNREEDGRDGETKSSSGL
jgi:hypothetical protein